MNEQERRLKLLHHRIRLNLEDNEEVLERLDEEREKADDTRKTTSPGLAADVILEIIADGADDDERKEVVRINEAYSRFLEDSDQTILERTLARIRGKTLDRTPPLIPVELRSSTAVPKPQVIRWPSDEQHEKGMHPGTILSVGQNCLLGGPGEMGKTTMLVQMAVRSADPEPSSLEHSDPTRWASWPDKGGEGQDGWWYGLEVRKGPVVFASYEDEEAIIARYASRILGTWRDDGSGKQIPRRVTFVDMKSNPLFGPPTNRDRGPRLYNAEPEVREPTWGRFWGIVRRALIEGRGDFALDDDGEAPPGIVVIDPAGSAFNCADYAVPATRAFLEAVRIEAEEIGCAVIFAAHPSKAARKAGQQQGADVISGSAAWSDASRGVLNMFRGTVDDPKHEGNGKPAQVPADHLTLRIEKANYGTCRGNELHLKRNDYGGSFYVSGATRARRPWDKSRVADGDFDGEEHETLTFKKGDDHYHPDGGGWGEAAGDVGTDAQPSDHSAAGNGAEPKQQTAGPNIEEPQATFSGKVYTIISGRLANRAKPEARITAEDDRGKTVHVNLGDLDNTPHNEWVHEKVGRVVMCSVAQPPTDDPDDDGGDPKKDFAPSVPVLFDPDGTLVGTHGAGKAERQSKIWSAVHNRWFKVWVDRKGWVSLPKGAKDPPPIELAKKRASKAQDELRTHKATTKEAEKALKKAHKDEIAKRNLKHQKELDKRNDRIAGLNDELKKLRKKRDDKIKKIKGKHNEKLRKVRAKRDEYEGEAKRLRAENRELVKQLKQVKAFAAAFAPTGTEEEPNAQEENQD